MKETHVKNKGYKQRGVWKWFYVLLNKEADKTL